MNKILKRTFLVALGAIVLGFPACQQEEVLDEIDATTLGGGGTTGLKSVLAVEYDQKFNQFVVVGEGQDGTLDAYIGDKDNFTKLADNRDFSGWISVSNFQDFAVGIDAEGKLDILGVMKDGRGSTGREFSGKPWLGDNQFKIGDLTSCLSVEYDQKYHRFVVVGIGPDGTLDAYIGDKGNFSKLANNRDFNKWIGASNFQDFAVGIGADGKLDILGIMKDGRGSTGREFSGKPWLGDNQFKIGDLTSCLAVEYDQKYHRFVVVGIGPDGTLDAYIGDKGNFTQLPDNRDFSKWIGASNFQDFSIGIEDDGTSEGKLDILGVMKDGRGSTGREFSGKPWLGDNQFDIP